MFKIELVDGTQYDTDKFSLSNGIRVIKENPSDFTEIETALTKSNLKLIKYLDAEGFSIRTEVNKEYKGRMLREKYGDDKWVITYYLDDVDVLKEEIETLKAQVAKLMAGTEA